MFVNDLNPTVCGTLTRRRAGSQLPVKEVSLARPTGLLSAKRFVFGDRGEFVPKGSDDAVRLYEVQWWEEQSRART